MTKPTKWHVRPAKTQVSLGIRPVWLESSLSAWGKLGSLATHWAHSEDWSVWAVAQADLSVCWVHSHFVSFVMRRLKLYFLNTCVVINSQTEVNIDWSNSKLWRFMDCPRLEVQGLDHRVDMAQACGSDHINPAVQALAYRQCINLHSAQS